MNELLTQRPEETTAEFPTPTMSTTGPMNVKRPRRWPLVTVVGVVALLCGIGAGVLVTMPQRNDLADQRDAARVATAQATDELEAATTSLDGLRAELTAAQDELVIRGADLDAMEADLATTIADLDAMTADLDAATADLDGMTTNRDECLLAATVGVDMADQWENMWSDYWTWYETEVGSAAEAEVALHIDEQWARMDEQHAAMHDALDACTAG